jgi:hypothetical protein
MRYFGWVGTGAAARSRSRPDGRPAGAGAERVMAASTFFYNHFRRNLGRGAINLSGGNFRE